MRSVTRLLLLALFGLLLVMPAVAACSAPSGGSDATTPAASVAQTTPPPASTPGATSASTGVDINAQSEDDADKTRRKLAMGVISVVLVAIVIWGRSVRGKKRKKTESAAKGK